MFLLIDLYVVSVGILFTVFPNCSHMFGTRSGTWSALAFSFCFYNVPSSSLFSMFFLTDLYLR